MTPFRYFLLSMCIFLAACKEEPKTDPVLDINRTWVVDHSGSDICEVSAIFTDDLLTFTYQSLVEQGCQPGWYGLPEDQVVFAIDSRVDFINDEGAPVAELVVSSPGLSMGGTVQLWASELGLVGFVVDAYDQSGEIAPYFKGVQVDLYEAF